MSLARDNWYGHDITTPAQRQWYGGETQPVDPATYQRQDEIAWLRDSIAWASERIFWRHIRSETEMVKLRRYRDEMQARLAEMVEPQNERSAA